MKLVLCRQKSRLHKFIRAVSGAVVVAVFVCVAVSQVYMAVHRKSIDVSLIEHGSASDYLELSFYKRGSGEAYIMCDGERYADVISGEMRVELSTASVIELYNGTGDYIDVKITGSSPGIEIIAHSMNMTCAKGINYICRCVCNV